MKIQAVSINHKTSKSILRALYSLQENDKVQILNTLKLKYNLKGCIILSTCNRTEIFYQSDLISPEVIRDELILFLDLPLNLHRKNFSLFNNSTCSVNHWMRVALGLESMILGDDQIYTQMRLAYKISLRQGMQGNLIERMFQYTVHLYRNAIKMDWYWAYRDSITKVGIYEVLNVIHDIPEKQKVLIIGAGSVAREAISYCIKFGFREIRVVNRTSYNAIRLANEFHVNSGDLSEVETTLSSYDVIISCVSNSFQMINMEIHGSLINKVLLDLSMPQSIEVGLGDFNHLITIDSLGKLKSLRNSQLAIGHIENLVNRYSQYYKNWEQSYLARNTISFQDAV